MSCTLWESLALEFKDCFDRHVSGPVVFVMYVLRVFFCLCNASLLVVVWIGCHDECGVFDGVGSKTLLMWEGRPWWSCKIEK